jgi:hypothetical protein
MQGSLYRKHCPEGVEVTLTSLDEFLKDQGVAKVDAVKIDAEGAELRIVRGMAGLLRGPDRPALLVEHNDTTLAAAGTSARELFRTIVAYGYTAYLIEDDRMRPVTDVVPAPAREDAYLDYLFLPDSALRGEEA